MSELFTLRPAREKDRELIDWYLYNEGMDRIPSLDNVTVAVNADDVCVGLCRILVGCNEVAHVNPVVVNRDWRGYGVGRALMDDALARYGELRFVARGGRWRFTGHSATRRSPGTMWTPRSPRSATAAP